MKKTACMILTAFLLLSALTACSTDPQAPAATDGGEPTAAPSSSGDFQTTGTPEPDDPPESPVSDFEYQLNSDGGITITKYIGNDANVVVPAFIEEKPVTRIGNSAFLLTPIQTIALPETLNAIDYAAFQYCQSLTAVKLPQELEYMDACVFAECSQLTSINLPDSLTEIPSSLFMNCTSLKQIDIPEAVTTIHSNAFLNCASLKQIRIPKAVTIIGHRVFEGTPLENVEFLEGSQLQTIGESAFYGTNLRSIQIPANVTEIQYQAFAECKQLESVVLPESVVSIGSAAFSSCTALTEIVIPKSVTSITEKTFDLCSALEKVKCEGAIPQDYVSSDPFLQAKNVHYTVYYHEGAVNDFTSPEWARYSTKVW